MRRLLLLLTVVVLAQSAPEVEITAEPHHHLAYTNDQVRVFNVEVPPHAETLMHRHRHDYVYVTLGPAEVVNAVAGKDPITVKLADGETRFVPGNFAHIARNQTDRPFRNVTIELLQDEKLRQASAGRDAAHTEDDRGLNLLKGGTQEILWVKDGIRASLFELQPGGVVPMHRHTGPYLLVAVSDVEVRERFLTDVHGPDIGYLKSGDAKWLPGGYSHTVINAGHTLARFVTLEFP